MLLQATTQVWDWARGDRGHKITETKCSTETVVAAEFHPLEGRTVVTVGKVTSTQNLQFCPFCVFKQNYFVQSIVQGFVNFWQLDPTSFTLSRKTGIFDARDKPKYIVTLVFTVPLSTSIVQH